MDGAVHLVIFFVCFPLCPLLLVHRLRRVYEGEPRKVGDWGRSLCCVCTKGESWFLGKKICRNCRGIHQVSNRLVLVVKVFVSVVEFGFPDRLIKLCHQGSESSMGPEGMFEVYWLGGCESVSISCA
ncbi:hypothetical protein V8F20_002975 [Naviculisporaceae sp. PSN 640]